MSHITARPETELSEREATVMSSPVPVAAPAKAARAGSCGSVLPLAAVPRRLSGIGPSATDRRH